MKHSDQDLRVEAGGRACLTGYTELGSLACLSIGKPSKLLCSLVGRDRDDESFIKRNEKYMETKKQNGKSIDGGERLWKTSKPGILYNGTVKQFGKGM